MDFPANTGTCQEINGSALLRGEEEGGTVGVVMDVALRLRLRASVR